MQTDAEDLPDTSIYTCDICRDVGWVYHNVPSGHILFGRSMRCPCRKENDRQEKAKRMLQYCQLPLGSIGYTFESYNIDLGSREAYQAALDVAEERLTWLILNGGRDRGKTHLAIAVCRRWLESGKVARYVHVPLLLDELRNGFDDKDRSFEQRFNHFKDVPLLVMDDLGVQAPTAWANERLQTLIDYRYINGLPLIVTINKPLDELPGDDEGRIESRLKRMEGSKLVALECEEYRKVRAK